MKIAITTGSRSEWGLLQPLAKLMHEDRGIDFKLLVTGSHLSYEFGYTKKDIDLPIEDEIECVLSSDTAVGISKALGLAVISFSETFKRLAPDLLVVLGDRWEILACSIAAHIARIPIAHVHGGEVTGGSYDDSWRHSISHMAQLHFPAAEAYRQRLIRMGQHPDSVFCVGTLGCDGLTKRNNHHKNTEIVVAYYSETISDGNPDLINEILYDLGITGIPIGTGYDVDFKKYEYLSLGKYPTYTRGKFLGILKKSDAIIGNSSSGIIEAPILGVPTINVGCRQHGRLMADSIIQSESTQKSMRQAFNKLYSKEFQDLMKSDYRIYYKGGNVAEKILTTIKQKMPISVKKQFYDVAHA